MHKVKTIVLHYGFDKTYYINDIAVVVVARKFNIGSLVKQATIIKPNTELAPNSVCTLIGWGTTQVRILFSTFRYIYSVKRCVTY